MPQSDFDQAQSARAVRRWLDSGRPGPLGDPSEPDLREIGEAHLAGADADVRMRAAVDDARRRGRSWPEIAAVLGISRQAARTRFGTLRMLYVDPERPMAKWMNVPGVDHEAPPHAMSLVEAGPPDPDGPRAGRYLQSGEQQDGRWVYRLNSVER